MAQPASISSIWPSRVAVGCTTKLRPVSLVPHVRAGKPGAETGRRGWPVVNSLSYCPMRRSGAFISGLVG